MADEIGVGIATAAAGVSSDWTITSSDLTQTAKAALLFFTAATTTETIADDTLQDGAIIGVGHVSDADGGSTTQAQCLSIRAVDNVATTQAVTRKQQGPATDRAIATIQRVTLNAIARADDLNSFVSQGVKFTPAITTDNLTAAALLFAGVARTYTNQISPSTSVQSETVGLSSTGGSFRPHLLIFFGQDGGGNTTSNDAHAALGFCIDDGSSSQVGHVTSWDNGSDPMDADANASTNRAGNDILQTTRTLRTVQITITSTGFNHQASSGTPDMWYLAIQFTEKPPMYVGNVALPSSPDSNFLLATPGITPRAIVSVNHLLASLDTLTDGSTAGSVGWSMFTANAARAYAVHNQEGIATTNTGKRYGNHAILTLNDAGTVTHQADLVGMESGGARLNFTTASAAGYATLLAIGVGNLTSVQNETVQISDSATLLLSQSLNVEEVVEISDGFVLSEQQAEFDLGDIRVARTSQGGAEVGRSLQGGAGAGRTVG